jgi:hypothetical protein
MKKILTTTIFFAGQLILLAIMLTAASNQAVVVPDAPKNAPSELVAWCGDGCDPELECCYLCANGCIYRISYPNCSRECL